LTLLTWLAARYPQPQIGSILMANAYRHPPLLAKMAASLEELSGGRLILSYGAGWVGDECRGYGYPFPPLGQRIEETVEAIRVMRLLWGSGPGSFEGRYYRLENRAKHPERGPSPAGDDRGRRRALHTPRGRGTP
jgi:alkanesulfonate monooxygenase SsuD/methylene tetrahydromethanopterin reductase-like flavin-dependent oxidoreductase (luciferase family)